jgi:acetyltransferase-like isoleucine patch superfamily enzyme
MIRFIYLFERFLRLSRILISSIITHIIFKFKGVITRGFILFDGIPHVSINSNKRGNISVGSNCRFNSNKRSNLIGINRKCFISIHNRNAKIHIGDNCGFSSTSIGCFTSIQIDDFVQVGANTLITDSDWHLEDKRVGPPKKVHIKKNAWIGYNSIILKGVTIGENSIIGAGSVVTRNIPDNVIAAGNPCVVIKKIEDFEK